MRMLEPRFVRVAIWKVGTVWLLSQALPQMQLVTSGKVASFLCECVRLRLSRKMSSLNE